MNKDQDNPADTRTWTPQSIGKRWQHAFFYGMIRLLGRGPAYAFMRVVCLWYVGLYPFVREKCAPYLTRRFPERTKRRQRFSGAYRMVTALGETLIDRAAFGILGTKAFAIDFPDTPVFLELLSEGKGLIILNAHVGCWQVCLSLFSHLQTPVSAVIQMHEGDVDRRYYEHSGQKPPFAIIDPESYLGGILEMVQALQRGEILAVMGDRVFGQDKNVAGVRFLGDVINVPVSPYRLASMQETPIAVILSHKSEKNRYMAEVSRIIRVPAGLGRNANAYAPFAQEFANTLEEFTAKHPWQFFNFYDMWYHGDD